MDFAYFVAPAVTAIVFLMFAVTADPKKNAIMRNMFFLASLIALLITVNTGTELMAWGDQVPNVALSTYTYNASGALVTINTTLNYTSIAPPIPTSMIDNIYYVISVVIWLVFALMLLMMFLSALAWITRVLGGRME